MDIKRINTDFSISGQPESSDIAALAASGIVTLICNRPDQEAEGQPEFSGLETAAVQSGLAIAHLPVVHDTISSQDVTDV